VLPVSLESFTHQQKTDPRTQTEDRFGNRTIHNLLLRVGSADSTAFTRLGTVKRTGHRFVLYTCPAFLRHIFDIARFRRTPTVTQNFRYTQPYFQQWIKMEYTRCRHTMEVGSRIIRPYRLTGYEWQNNKNSYWQSAAPLLRRPTGIPFHGMDGRWIVYQKNWLIRLTSLLAGQMPAVTGGHFFMDEPVFFLAG